MEPGRWLRRSTSGRTGGNSARPPGSWPRGQAGQELRRGAGEQLLDLSVLNGKVDHRWYLSEARNVVLLGPPGTGKTLLAADLASRPRTTATAACAPPRRVWSPGLPMYNTPDD